MESLGNLFLEKDEHRVTALGNIYLQRYLWTGREEGGFCIVSNYRLYIKGIFYQRKGRRYRKCRQAQIVDLSDVRSCDVVVRRSIWRRGEIPMMEFVCGRQVLAMEISACSDFECQEFQKHLRMMIAYDKRQ